MKHKNFLKLFLALMCSLMILSPLNGKADFGDYAGDNDYGFDHDNDDYGGYDNDDDDDYYYGDSSGDDTEDIFIDAVSLTVAIAFYVMCDIKKKKRRKNRRQQQRPQYTQQRGQDIFSYKSVDPEFDITALIEKLGNIYVQMQHCWTNKDIEPVRPYFSDALFNQMNNQLQHKNKLGQTNYVERIAVLEVAPRTWYQEGGMDHIIAQIKTRIVDYTLDDKTGKLISGSKTAEKFMTYEWNISRKTGVITNRNNGLQTINCPNCGAALDINATAKCPYCDSVININQQDWVICNIKAISQRTK